MTREEVLRALADGKKVQRLSDGPSTWRPFGSSYDYERLYPAKFKAEEHRLTPEPVPPGDLTWEEAKALQHAGVVIEVKFNPEQEWRQLNMLAESLDEENREHLYTYRRKPEPKRVPLEPKDVPPGSVIRHKTWLSFTWAPVAPVQLGLLVMCQPADPTKELMFLSWGELTAGWSICTDRRTWTPCSKLEGE